MKDPMKDPWSSVPYRGSLKEQAFQRGLAFRMAGHRCAWYLYRRHCLREAFKEGYRAAKLFDVIHAVGPLRHDGVTWYLANRAAVNAAAAALGHTGWPDQPPGTPGPIYINGKVAYVHEEPLRSLISLVVLRVLDAVAK